MRFNIRSFTAIVFFISLFTAAEVEAQEKKSEINPFFLNNYWPASWITHPTADLKAYGVYHFRKAFELSSKPSTFIIHVTADNRYRLFVNGVSVCFGPARGDLNHWYYESIDIAGYLQAGKNQLAAVVWNCGDQMPVAQMSRKTGFLLQGNTEAQQAVNTDKSWKVIKNEAYSPLAPDHQKLQSYIVVGPGDAVNGDMYPWNWQNLAFDDSKWLTPNEICKGRAKGLGTGSDWDLIPRDIPFMEETVQRFSSVRRAEGCKAGDLFLQGKEPLTIPANTKAVLLLDQGFETVAYPEITVSGGKGSAIELIYAEGLFDKDGIIWIYYFF